MSKLLEDINYPRDVKTLTNKELYKLSDEIREFLIEQVSKTGGHLSSNLGVVELTLSLYKTFNFEKDKIVWDVGHQTYVHKILTGRKDKFDTLRKYKGLCGFPKISESKYDAFGVGHSSTSISAALGIARARDIKHEDYNVIAFGRFYLDNILFTVVNNNDYEKEVRFSVRPLGMGYEEDIERLMLTSETGYNAGVLKSHISNGEFHAIMPPRSAAVYRKVTDEE